MSLACDIESHPELELIVIDFGKAVEFVVLTPQQAIEMSLLLAAAVEIMEPST